MKSKVVRGYDKLNNVRRKEREAVQRLQQDSQSLQETLRREGFGDGFATHKAYSVLIEIETLEAKSIRYELEAFVVLDKMGYESPQQHLGRFTYVLESLDELGMQKLGVLGSLKQVISELRENLQECHLPNQQHINGLLSELTGLHALHIKISGLEANSCRNMRSLASAYLESDLATKNKGYAQPTLATPASIAR